MDFVERLPAHVGHNLRHHGGGQHVTGHGCPCKPERVPHHAVNHEPGEGRHARHED